MFLLSGLKEREERSTRSRRATTKKRDCSLVLVADYRYYKSIGQESRQKTLYAMVSGLLALEKIFPMIEQSCIYKVRLVTRFFLLL